MRRDARAEIECHAVEVIARSRWAIGSAFLQAIDVRIAEVPATRALREVATKRREVPDLRRGKALRACRHTGIDLSDAGYPDSYFLLLQQLGIGLKNQDILDVGTGTGALALPFARQGSHVTGVDISKGQIEAAKTLASQKKLNIRFIVAKAEETGLPDKSFDVITSSMSWGYLDQKKMPEEAARLLRKNGLLLISSLNWVHDADAITQRTGELLKKYGSERERQRRREAGFIVPEWAKEKFRLRTYHTYYITIPFTKESWRGRIRASRGVGAILSREKTEEFDGELEKLLDQIGQDHFDIRHRITFYIFELKS